MPLTPIMEKGNSGKGFDPDNKWVLKDADHKANELRDTVSRLRRVILYVAVG